MLIAVEQAVADAPVRGGGDVVDQRNLFDTVATPDSGNGQDVHRAGKRTDQRGLLVGDSRSRVDGVPTALLFGRSGSEVAGVAQGDSELGGEEVGGEHGGNARRYRSRDRWVGGRGLRVSRVRVFRWPEKGSRGQWRWGEGLR